MTNLEIALTPPNGQAGKITLTARQNAVAENVAQQAGCTVHELEASLIIPVEQPSFITAPTAEYAASAKRERRKASEE